jgi:hypothetical protein
MKKFYLILLLIILFTFSGCSTYRLGAAYTVPVKESPSDSVNNNQEQINIMQRAEQQKQPESNKSYGASLKFSGNTSGSSKNLSKSKVNMSYTKPEPIKILHFGDLMLDRYVKTLMDKNGNDFIFENFAPLSEHSVKNYNIIAANLEGPFANRRIQTSKSIAFRFEPEDIEWLWF